MPYTSGKLKGQLTAEIRKLIRGHNKLVSIKIPPKTDRDGLIKLIEDHGYKLDHKKQMISDARKTRPRRQKVTLDQAKELTKPKPLTEEQKKKRQQAKQKKEGQKAFLKKVIPKPPPVSKKSKGIKVGKPPSKLYEKEYDKFFKMFNEAKERRNRKPFLELRDRIYRFTEPILVKKENGGQVQDGERMKALKEPFMKKIRSLLTDVDKEIKKYVEMGKKTVGGQQTQPKKEIKMTQKPSMNTKKIEPKKKETSNFNQRDKLNKDFIERENIFDPKLRELYNEKGEKDPTFRKLYKKKLNAIAEYRSKSGGQSKTTELKKMRTAWFKAWIEGDQEFKKFLSR